MTRPKSQTRVLNDSPELVDQHHRLDQLDVAEFGVPVDVSRSYQHCLMYLESEI